MTLASLFTKRGRWLLPAIGGLAAVLVVVGILGANGWLSPGPRDLYGKPVTYELDAKPNPEASAVPSGFGHFVATSVGLNVPLGSLDAVDGQVTPPGFTSAYLIRNHGVTPQHADSGAVYVVMHSLRDGAVGPGNALIDVDKQQARIERGAVIAVDGIDYRVTGTESVSKADLPQSAIWTAGPNQLIVITCLQRPQGGPSVDNIVIVAERTK